MDRRANKQTFSSWFQPSKDLVLLGSAYPIYSNLPTSSSVQWDKAGLSWFSCIDLDRKHDLLQDLQVEILHEIIWNSIIFNYYNCFYPRWVPASATWAWGCSRLELRSASISDISLSLALARKNLAYRIFSQATAAASKLLIGLTPRETLYRRSMADLYWSTCTKARRIKKTEALSPEVYTVDTVYDCVVFQFRGTIRLCEFKAPDFSTSTMVPFRNRFEDLDDKSTLWRLLVGSSNLWVGRAKEKLTLC